MILIISKKNDLISYGFFKAFKTIYKNVDIIYNSSKLNDLNKYKIIIINNYDFYDKIKLNNNLLFLLINENCLFQNILNNNNIKYYIIKEYSNDINFNNFNKLDKYMYYDDNIIIIPYCSIFTKNEILWNYKKKIILNKKIPNKIITFDNLNNKYSNKIIKLNIEKINLNSIDNIINKYNNNNIFLSFYDNNKFNFKAISHMAFGNYSISNSNVHDIFNIININDLNNKNIEFNKIIENIQIIYNDFTFEKYIKIINNYFLSVV